MTDPEKVEAQAEAQAYNRRTRRTAAATGKDPQDILEEDDGPQWSPADPNDVFLSARKTWERYSVSSMSLHRWLKDPRMGFPRPTYIARRRYWKLSALVAWERARAAGREVRDS